MSKTEKLKEKLLSGSNLKWTELVNLLKGLGYSVMEGSGNRVKFAKEDRIISLHCPHPNPEIKHHMTKYVIEQLRIEGDL